MNIREKFNKFLASIGFELIEEYLSPFFGDFSDTYSNENVYIHVVSDRSIISIHVSSLEDKEVWFDLGLLTDLLSDEQDLTKVKTEEEHRDFLETHLSDIYDLFSKKNYFSTKKRLNLLGEKRAKQLFPNS